jgi:glycosyltransferase involved in cell wall biosynthesis
MKKILAFRNDWNGLGPKGTDLIGGVGYYRIQKPMQFLRKEYDVLEFGDFLTLQKNLKAVGKDWEIDDVVPNLIKDADLIVMKNISHPVALAQFVGAADYYKKPLILDMDDDYLSVDDLNPKRKYFNENEMAQIVHKELFRSATAIIVSTEPLKKVYKEFNPNVHVIENYNDVTDWKYEKVKRPDNKIVIGWAGSQTHEADFHVIEPVIKQIWEKYGDRVVFAICGGLPPKLTDTLPKGSYAVFSGTRTMRDYHQRLALWGFDIGMAPLKKSKFNDGKSHGKWMEYAMYRIPTVATNFGPYKRVIEHGLTGLLCDTTEEWVAALSHLIDSSFERYRIGHEAYQEVWEKWQWKDNYTKWIEIFDKYIDHGFAKQTEDTHN